MSNALGKYAASQKSGKAATPNTERSIGRTDEVKNNTGGFTFKVSDKDRLDRFLILGTDKGTYYVNEQKLTGDNVKFLNGQIKTNERGVVDAAVDVSTNGRALKNSPAIYAIASVMVNGQDKAYAREAMRKIVRTSTHLFEYGQYIDSLGGWGKAKRRSVADWYSDKTVDAIAYQAVKYRQRNGWTHRDMFRLSHPVGIDQSVGRFILGKDDMTAAGSAGMPDIIRGFKFAQESQTVSEVLSVIGEYKNLPWEAIPTQFLTDKRVWKTLFYNGQLRGQALIRNVTRLARNGAFDDMVFAADYAAAIADAEMIEKTRLHPINFLNALVVFDEGSFDRRSVYSFFGYDRKKDWKVNAKVKDALNEGFHLAFKSVQPAGKRTLVATDISGSMSCSAIGLDLSCAQVSAAIGMTIARTEPYSDMVGFSSQIIDLEISAKDSLASAMKKVSNRNFGSTDPAKAIQYANQRGIDVDTFIIITDNETNCGHQKPFQALKEYRQKTGIDARLAVLGVASTDFTVADPTDKGTMDFCGFDANAPRALADFSAGRI
jgi:60 kDa SS-A/Ro ribonucleoprotein